MTGIDVELGTVVLCMLFIGSVVPWLLKHIPTLNHLTIKKASAIASVSISIVGFMTAVDLTVAVSTEKPFATQTCVNPSIVGPVLTCRNNQYVLSVSTTLFYTPATLPNTMIIHQGPFSKLVYLEEPL